MARTRGCGLGAQSRPRGRLRGRGTQIGRRDIVERVENANRSENVLQDGSPSEASVGNERRNVREHDTGSK